MILSLFGIDNPLILPEMNKKHSITICLGSSCYTRGNDVNLEIIKNFLQVKGLKDQIDFRGHLCENSCSRGPMIKIDGTIYYEVTSSQIEKILLETLLPSGKTVVSL